MHTKEFIRLGNCTIGLMSIGFPFARLKVNQQRIEIQTIVGAYEFESFQICTILPVKFLGIHGIKILHRKISYPKNFVFYYLGSRDKFWSQLSASTFPINCSKLPAAANGGLIVLRSSFLTVSSIALISLYIIGGKSIFFSGVMAWGLALHSLIPIQKLGLKKNRHIDEIRHWLRFCILFALFWLVYTQ